MVLPSGEQHGIGRCLRSLTAFLVCFAITGNWQSLQIIMPSLLFRLLHCAHLYPPAAGFTEVIQQSYSAAH